MKKKATRIINMIRLASLRAKLIPTSVVISNYSRLDMARMGNGIVYNQMLNESKNNIKDAIIADTAVTESCTLITEDVELYKKMKRHSYSVMNITEFLTLLQNFNNEIEIY